MSLSAPSYIFMKNCTFPDSKKKSKVSSTPLNPLLVLSFRPQSYQNFFMTTRVKRPPIQWAFIPSGEMCLQLGVSADTLKDWRVAGVLKKGLYWTTFPHIPSRIFWNRDLVRDWFVNANSPAHQRAIERYLASLPSSDEYKPTAS